MDPKIKALTLVIAIVTLAFVVNSLTLAMIVGLFKAETDHAAIIEILKPAFYTALGVMVGVVTTMALNHASDPPTKPPS